MAKKSSNMLICNSCGGEYTSDSARCPYCGTVNIPGAEKEYMNKLDNIEGKLDDLQWVSLREMKKAVCSLRKYIKVIAFALVLFIIVVCIRQWIVERATDVSTKEMTVEDYLWQVENYPEWDKLYEEGKYDELMLCIQGCYRNGCYVSQWERYAFFQMWQKIDTSKKIIALEGQGGELTDEHYRYLLSAYWDIKGMAIYGELTEDELDFLRNDAEIVLADFDTRWDFTEEEYNLMYEEYLDKEGWIRSSTCRKMVEAWKERQ